MPVTDFWLVVQAAALVTAGFGVWILARACWDYAGLPSVQDAYLQAVGERLQELGPLRPARRREAAYLRRTRRALHSRPTPAERAASQRALLQLLNRPALEAAGRPGVDHAVSALAARAAAAGSVGGLAATQKELRVCAAGLLRSEVPRRFLAAFLPGMARYLDFVGRGSSLGLAVGVLLAGGLAGNADLVGALTSVCGVAGAVVFTLTVIRCESRSWPAGQSGLWLRAARRYPQAFFLLRLALTTTAVLLGVHLVRT